MKRPPESVEQIKECLKQLVLIEKSTFPDRICNACRFRKDCENIANKLLLDYLGTT